MWKLYRGENACTTIVGKTLVSVYPGRNLIYIRLNKLHRYRPGDVCFFLSGSVYHAVSKWEPTSMKAEDKLTPGRIGNVFFFPDTALSHLTGKPPGWGRATGFGSETGLYDEKQMADRYK